MAHLRSIMHFIASDITSVSLFLSCDLDSPFMIVSMNLHMCTHFGSKKMPEGLALCHVSHTPFLQLLGLDSMFSFTFNRSSFKLLLPIR